jgi:hypothetical protein
MRVLNANEDGVSHYHYDAIHENSQATITELETQVGIEYSIDTCREIGRDRAQLTLYRGCLDTSISEMQID